MIAIDRRFVNLLDECLSRADGLFGNTAQYTIEAWGTKVVLKVSTPLPYAQAAAAADKLDDWARLQAVRCDGRLLVTMEYV